MDKRVEKAQGLLKDYRRGKATLDARVVENDQWYRLRHWQNMRPSSNPGDPEPTSAWLLNCLLNKHADAMDNYPEPIVLPREEGDGEDANVLSAVLPVILEQNEFEKTYSDMWWQKLKSGAGIMGVFWNPEKLHGLGDVEIRNVDILHLFWEPGVHDIQKSKNVFYVELQDNEELEKTYPQLEGKLGTGADKPQEYEQDDALDTSDKSAVVDWYYKKGGTVHFIKYVNDELLYASEDDEAYRERGFYDHGKYPFVFDELFSCEGSPVGFGYLDVCKQPQMYIDRLNQVIMKNAVMAARPRWFVRADGMINEEEYADWEKDFVHYNGSGNPEEHIRPIHTTPVSEIHMALLNSKIEELKETSGNRDFSQGGTTAGVTAASAIAALQEAGSKLSRDMIRASYRAFTQVCYLVIELVRQFYEEPRSFRIVGTKGAQQFVLYSNARLREQAGVEEYGVRMGTRCPVFDIKIRPQKANAFSRTAQNELAKEFYSLHFFDPANAVQALSCLEMMDFEGKDIVAKKIAEQAERMEYGRNQH
ncbi:MAG: hypothetical protein E7335_00200 [Clostridiales bacterium]|nr:hypothetical protein [Clostridiales bacterium]